jgi:lipoyl(octanoyl) transferase
MGTVLRPSTTEISTSTESTWFFTLCLTGALEPAAHMWAIMLEQALSPSPLPTLRRPDVAAAGWAVSAAPVGYDEAVAAMEARAAEIADGRAGELVWLLEHPPLYTAGVSARAEDLLQPGRLPVHRSGRGGQFTYHGPGQRVAYLMLDLNVRGRDVRAFVRALEAWLIAALAEFNVRGEIRPERVGVWVERKAPGLPRREDKIAAIGVKLRRWVSFHGVSLNVEPDLTHFAGIVPCGIAAHGVTSLVDLGLPVTMDEADAALRTGFEGVFGPVQAAPTPL